VIWRSHMVLGASSWLAAQTLAGPITGTPLNTGERACGAVIAAGAALLCDMDTPASRLAHTLGPITRLAATVIGRVLGGHRRGTHSLAFCAAAAALSALALAQPEVVDLSGHLTLTAGQLAALAIGCLTSALSVSLLLPLRGARAALVTAALVTAAATTVHPAPGLVTAAVAIGCLSHLLGDIVTPKGVMPLWPLRSRCVSLPLIKRTGDAREQILILVLATVTLAIAGGYL
jgi:membrane-bound metal-dependent hydrolase YbcI (DUF457 family)